MPGKVQSIQIAAKGQTDLYVVSSAELVPGKGIVGDRYYNGSGTFSHKLGGLPDCEVTLIESEEIEAFNHAAGLNHSALDFRRNILTTGIRLNELVGKEFTIGSVRLKGVRLCEPCAHLATILGRQILEQMVHKAGIRAQVLSAGNIQLGGTIEIL